MVELIVVFLLGVIASFISNISGGGGYLIMLPALQLMGVPPLEAIGTIKFGGIGMVIGAGASTRNKKVVRKDYLRPLLIITIVSSIIGPQLALLPSENTIRLISSVLIVVTALASIISWQAAESSRQPSRWQKYIGYGLFFVISTIFSGFGSGLGILINYIVIGFLGMSALETISTRRILGLIGLPIQMIVFLGEGVVNIPLGIALLLGTAIGGFFGLNMAIKKGNTFVKRAMAVVALILVSSLFI